MMKPMITAHSGCEDTKDDSMESIDLALEYGADAIEIDVRIDKNGILRISHNEASTEEFQQKLTLDDVFAKILNTGLSVNCDIKEQAALYPTLAAAKKTGLSPERLILSGCTSPDILARDPSLIQRGQFFLNIEEVLKLIYLRRERDFDIQRFPLLMRDPWKILKENGIEIRDEWVEDTVQCYKMVHAAAANLPKTLLNSNLVSALKAASVPLSIWTVNEPELVTLCLNTGVCNITTRKVQQAIEITEKYS